MRIAVILLLLITACASPQFQPVQESLIPQSKLTRDRFYAADGAALPLKSWLPGGTPKAVVLAVHGFNDYSNAFQEPGSFFKKHGVAMYAYDQRGFGAAPQTGIWADERNLVADLKQCVLQLKARYPKIPFYILGESMGGAVTMVALADDKFPPVDGIILSAPAVWGGMGMNPLFHVTLWVMAHTAPDRTFTGEDLRILASDNIPILNAMARDPLIIKATRADTIYGLVQLMGNAYAKAPEVKTRALLLYGERDEVVPRGPVEEVAERFAGPLEVVYYPNGYHMLLRDLQRQRVMEDILRWIQEQKPLS